MLNSPTCSYCSALPFWKRSIDICFCVMALPFLAVFALAGAIHMQLTSPGPLFFRQERVGHRGKRFRIYKFRTMHVSASTATHLAHFAELHKSAGPMQKLDAQGDSRLIRGARLIRASGLDELPQIINVLRGDMSLVGPRPCIPYEYEMYTPEQSRRLWSVPGLTGLWQVSGKNKTSFAEMVELDIAYAQQLSLATDLKIMLLTGPVLALQIMETRTRRARQTIQEQSDVSCTETPFKTGVEFQRS